MSLPDGDLGGSGNASQTQDKPRRFILLSLPESVLASVVLKEGDKAQAKTLQLLEETHAYMDKHVHNRLHERYDDLKTNRLEMKHGFIKRIQQWDKIVVYRDRSIKLKKLTVVSSELARSEELWKHKRHRSSPKNNRPSHDAASTSHQSTVDETLAEFVDASPVTSQLDANVDAPATSPVDPPAAPEDAITVQPRYVAVEADSEGQPVGGPVSFHSEIELQDMIKRGQLEEVPETPDDSHLNPFADSRGVAVSPNAT